MIQINLLPVKQLKAEVARWWEIRIAATSLVVTLLLIGGVYIYQARQVSALTQHVSELRKELDTLNVRAKEMAELQLKIKEFQEKNKIIEAINRKKSGPVRVMQSLAAATPNSLWLNEFKETGGNLTMTGVAMDNQTIAEFLKLLGNYPYFTTTELVETSQTDKPGLPPRKFVIKSRLSYQPNVSRPAAEGGGVEKIGVDKPATGSPPQKGTRG